MAYLALYRKWRPMTFDEVVEQEAVVTVLRNAVITGRIAHAYLFCGTRGTGKTTMAKIFARAVNCLNPQHGNPCNECDVCRGILSQQILDVSEIDAASNNGVDNVRSIIEETAYSASVAKYKVFIIDEVHMLSSGAFNALLKTLEEPPEGVIFILATTEPNKLPVTILSRCQRYDFKRISQKGIIGRLEYICKEQNINYEMPALAFLAQKSDGALRDAISLLDQTLASCGDMLTLKAARASTGSIDKEFVETFAINIIESRGAEILKQISVLFSEGRDPSDFIAELMQIYRSALVVSIVKNTEGILYETDESMALLKKIASEAGHDELSLIIRELSKLDSNLKWAVQRKILFEAGMLTLCDRKWDGDESELAQRISALERHVSDIVHKYNTAYVPAVTPEHTASDMEQPGGTRSSIAPIAPEAYGATEASGASGADVNTNNSSITNDSNTDNNLTSGVMSEPSDRQDTQIARNTPQTASASTETAPVSGRSAEGIDWDEFIKNISSKGQASLSSLIKINGKGVLDGRGNLVIVFANPIVKDMIVKKDATEILSESATAAYGSPLRVLYAAKKELSDVLKNAEAYEPAAKSAVPTPPPNSRADTASGSGNGDDTFQNAVRILKELSEKEGFTVEDK